MSGNVIGMVRFFSPYPVFRERTAFHSHLVNDLLRCVQLTWSPGVDDPTAWTDLISKLKEGVMSSFDASVALREDEVKRSESQRTMPGWNFCTFFTLKVRRA